MVIRLPDNKRKGAATERMSALLIILVLVLSLSPGEASAETRLYHLRVTLRSGERYETISTHDPVNYCHGNGGSVIYMPDYSLIFSPEMKIKVMRTWMYTGGNLKDDFVSVLKNNRMLAVRNHRTLPRVEPLTLADMLRPE
jgi:hypothetical protein